MMDTTSPHHARYVAVRDELVTQLRTTELSPAQMVEASEAIYGSPEKLSLYGIPAPAMTDAGIRLLGRTAVECVIDDYVHPVTSALATIHRTMSADREPMVVDLFCGSGNFGHQVGSALGLRVHTSELDPDVHRIAAHNLGLVRSTVDLRHTDYRDLLKSLQPSSVRDVYLLEPPWGPAVADGIGLDLTRVSPPVADILDDVRRSRGGMPCLVVIKTNDRIVGNSLETTFRGTRRLQSVTPPPTLAFGYNMDFHIFHVPGVGETSR